MNPAPRVHARALAVALIGALALVACGANDEPVAEPGTANTADDTSPDTGASPDGPDATVAPDGPDATVAPDGPDATVAPDLPEEFAGSIGPVEVVGDSLPALEVADIEGDSAIGMTAPVLVGEDYAGNTVRVDAAADGPAMVVFLAHWCPHCNAEIPRINELRDDGRFPAGLDVVAVSTAVSPGQPNFPPAEWLTDKDWTYPVIADGVDMARQTFIAADAYGVSAFPFVALVDADGKVVARWSGESTPDEIIDRIATYLSLS